MPILGLTLSVLLAAPAAPSPAADAYAGRWNVRITDVDVFVSGGFQIEKGKDGWSGAIVWRWGSFAPVKSVAVEKGALSIVREETPGRRDVFEARLDGDLLLGTVSLADGSLQHFEGRRAPELTTAAPAVWGEPVTLFDGRSLGGFRLRDAKAKNGWAVVRGELAVVEPQGNADLVSERSFQDQKLHVEFNLEPQSNSGVYVRGRYEIQLLDDPKLAQDTHGCGAVYSRIAPRVDATRPAGEWQTLDVTMVGRQITVVLNGETVVDGPVAGITGGALDPFEEAPGPLMLQGDHGKVRFRNVVVTPAK